MTESGSDERQFIHDIAGPLGTALLMMGIVVEGLQERAAQNQEELTQIALVTSELEKIRGLLVDRRRILIERGIPSSQSKEVPFVLSKKISK